MAKRCRLDKHKLGHEVPNDMPSEIAVCVEDVRIGVKKSMLDN
jgi:hypothetical protein